MLDSFILKIQYNNMVNHTVKSIIILLIFVIIAVVTPVYGENFLFNEKHGFSLSGGMGIFYGTSYEIVYKYSGEKEYLSELQWNIKPLLYFGINLDYGLKEPTENRGFFIGIGLKAGIPMQTGIIEDRDWEYNVTPAGSLTHFSSHENHTKAAFFLNINSGYSLPVWKLILKFYLNFDYMYFKWEARNGYTQYGPNGNFIPPYIPWEPSFPKKDPPSKLGITYSQHWILFNTGIGAEFPLGRFAILASVYIGPAICIAFDYHHNRNITFIDTVYKGLYLKPKLGVSFTFTNHFEISLSAMYTYIGETRGDTSEKINGIITNKYYDTGGAAFKAFEGSLLVKYRL
ncbi:MAG: omptin family outer membrane protease [Clostridiales bacterium]|nr:omptin family outer membrane protease [Clostridiales bacterium]